MKKYNDLLNWHGINLYKPVKINIRDFDGTIEKLNLIINTESINSTSTKYRVDYLIAFSAPDLLKKYTIKVDLNISCILDFVQPLELVFPFNEEEIQYLTEPFSVIADRIIYKINKVKKTDKRLMSTNFIYFSVDEKKAMIRKTNSSSSAAAFHS